MAIIVDDLVAWLVTVLSDSGRRRLTDWIFGDEQERALRQAATAAVQRTAQELCPGGGEGAGVLATVVSEVFGRHLPALATAGDSTLLERLQSGIASQVAVLDDASLTGTGRSSSQLLGVSGAAIARSLTSHLVSEIKARAERGGPLTPVASHCLDGKPQPGQLPPAATHHRRRACPSRSAIVHRGDFAHAPAVRRGCGADAGGKAGRPDPSVLRMGADAHVPGRCGLIRLPV